MRESPTIQAFIEEGRRKGLEEGRAGEARKIILRLGRKRLGAVDETVGLETGTQLLIDSGWVPVSTRDYPIPWSPKRSSTGFDPSAYSRVI